MVHTPPATPVEVAVDRVDGHADPRGARRRTRNAGRGRDQGVRALLPRRPVTCAQLGRQRTRSRDRAGDDPRPRRRGRARHRAGTGHDGAHRVAARARRVDAAAVRPSSWCARDTGGRCRDDGCVGRRSRWCSRSWPPAACAGDLEYLAGDAIGGRNNDTPGSTSAQNYLLGYLPELDRRGERGRAASTRTSSRSRGGTNLVGVLPGTDLADEYVMIGAHYDNVGHVPRPPPGRQHLQRRDRQRRRCRRRPRGHAHVCLRAPIHRAVRSSSPSGIVRRTVCSAPSSTRRTRSSRSIDTVAYVNLDIQGANLRPSLRNFSVAVGAETGGPRFRELVSDAIAGGTARHAPAQRRLRSGSQRSRQLRERRRSERVLQRRDRALLPHRQRRCRCRRLRQARRSRSGS